MTVWLWVGFITFVLVMLAIDLGVLNRKAHVIRTREALQWTGVCAALALLFTIFVHYAYRGNWFGIGTPQGLTVDGHKPWLVFLTGYIIEMSLSMDNIFVIALIFAYFGVPRQSQHRVLFWGILGALVMRGIMILAGTALIAKFHWFIYIFGALLILTALKMLFAGEGKVEPDRNPLVRLARFLYPVTPHFEGEHFFTQINGKRAITPLFLCLLIIESTDVLFAIDSIPAIFAITRDPFIVFTSNVFAILCLRSMYFALAGMIAYFRFLKYSLVFLLAYVGVKMLISPGIIKIETWFSLLVILGALAAGIIVSILHPARPEDIPPTMREEPEPDSGTA